MTTTNAPSTIEPRNPVGLLRRTINRAFVAVASLLVPLTVVAFSEPAGAAVPGVNGVQPPGTNGLNTILGWGGWIVGFLGVAGILVVAGLMVIKHNRGEAGESYAKLGTVMAGLVVGSGASLLAGALYA